MNKTELIEKIAQGAGLTKVDAKKALDATIEAIKGALKKGDKVQLVTGAPHCAGHSPLHR